MSIFQKVITTIVTPAYDLVTLEKAKGAYVNGSYKAVEYINLKAGDRVQLGDAPPSEYLVYSVMSCALQDGECPIVAYNRAIQHGHDVYFIVNGGACVSKESSRSPRRVMLQTEDVVKFEGKFFNVLESANNNLCLKELEF